MNPIGKTLFTLSVLITLSACRVEPDWTTELVSTTSDEAVVTLHDILPHQDKTALAVYQQTPSDWTLAVYGEQGLLLREGELKDLPEGARLSDSARYDGRQFLLLGTDAGSRLVALDRQLAVLWQRHFEPVALSAMAIQGRRIYLTGESTLVLDWSGKTVSRLDHEDAGYATLSIGLFNDIYVANGSQVAAYGDGGLLWQRDFALDSPVGDSRLLWADGQLYYAQMNARDGGVSVHSIAARSGDCQWHKAVEPMARGLHVARGPQEIQVREDGLVMVLQSTSGGRQLTALDGDVGRLLWQVDYASSVATDSALVTTASGAEQLLWSGSGRTELYSDGRRVARAGNPFMAGDSRVVAVEGGAFVAESVVTPAARRVLQLHYYSI